MTPSRVITLDIEIMRPVEDHPDGWEGAREGGCGISSVCLYDTETERYHFYDEHTIDDLCDHIECADILVSYNGENFDLPCIAGVACRYLTLRHHYDILSHIWIALGERTKGYRLGEVCRRTLGIDKARTGEGAPRLAQQGRWAELFDYNLHDVWLTRKLYNHVVEHGTLIDHNGNPLILEAPRDRG